VSFLKNIRKKYLRLDIKEGEIICHDLIQHVVEMKLDTYGQTLTTTKSVKSEAFRIASLKVTYSTLNQFPCTFVTERPDSFLYFLKNVISPVLQIACVEDITKMIVGGFNEVLESVEYIVDKEVWFGTGLKLINKLMECRENISMVNAIVVDVLLVFLLNIESSEDPSVKDYYLPKFETILNKFVTNEDPAVRGRALCEYYHGLPSLLTPKVAAFRGIKKKLEK